MTESVVLYWVPLSQNSRVVHYFLEAAQIEADRVLVDPSKDEQKEDWYLEIAPTGLIPAMKDGATSIFESSSIIRYLCLKCKSNLLPSNDLRLYGLVDASYESLRQRPWDIVNRYCFLNLMDVMDSDQDELLQMKEKIDEALQLYSSFKFKQHPHFVVGTRMTLADIALATLMFQLQLIDEDIIPGANALNEWWANHQELDIFKKVHNPCKEQIAEYIS
eukprot:TRINITY_DN584_c0_g1_i2.p1 TRINITY_DN584_c0_g1~~TRINITY_DN584_c0_g1_i2.p1  ORF type:complete len:219 (+),score=47.68 TRINITY_DN584_c0_g1_i2:53-709(+)